MLKTNVKDKLKTAAGAVTSVVQQRSKQVSIDLSKKTKPKGDNGNGFFQKAMSVALRFKGFFWGGPGVGKTMLALQFPNPVMIDYEKGSIYYGSKMDFDVMHANEPDELFDAIDYLLTEDHEYRTLIIDPISVWWEKLLFEYEEKMKITKVRSPHFWTTVKKEFKRLMNKLRMLDMNVIVIARQKTQYEKGTGDDFIKAVGEIFDGDRNLPHEFDTVLHLYTDTIKDNSTKEETFIHKAICMKDRTSHFKLGEKFEIDYEYFKKLYGADLERKAQKVKKVTTSQLKKIRNLLEQIGASETDVSDSLSKYGVSRLEELLYKDAQTIIKNLEANNAN